MITQKTWNFISDNEGPLINFSIKGKQALWNKLDAEAKSKGKSFSPYCAWKLENYEKVEEERRKAVAEVAELKQKNLTLANERSRHLGEIEELKKKNVLLETASQSNIQLKKEIEELKKQNSALNEQQAIFKHERLNNLFNEVKGTQDTILTWDGKEVTITYNDPEDVLWSFLYAFKPKKQ